MDDHHRDGDEDAHPDDSLEREEQREEAARPDSVGVSSEDVAKQQPADQHHHGQGEVYPPEAAR